LRKTGLTTLGPKVTLLAGAARCDYVKRMRYRSAVQGTVVVLVGCQPTSQRGLPASDFCDAMANTACAWLEGCNPGARDRATCIAGVQDTWDGCPPAVAAIANGEVRYHEEEAQAVLDAIRAAPCTDAQFPLPDVQRALEGTLPVGATCHSNFSCVAPLRCNEFSLAEPMGTCGEVPHADAGAAGTPMPSNCIPGMTLLCTCPDGTNGAQLCMVDGTLSACACSPPTP